MPDTFPIPQPVADAAPLLPDLVILVHGTFAGSTDEEGPRWYQRGSEHWRWLQEHLPPGVVLPDHDVRRFTWDSRNSQVSRLDAGNRLLAFLLELERQGRNYHLVGHSHGGSVIWEALVTAEVTLGHETVYPELRRALNDGTIRLAPQPIIPLRKNEYVAATPPRRSRYEADPKEYAAVRATIRLPGLRSWTTVGTPFMRYLPVSRAFSAGWPRRRLCLPRGQHLASASKRTFTDVFVYTSMWFPYLVVLLVLVAGLLGVSLQSPGVNRFAGMVGCPLIIWWLLSIWLTGRRHYARALLTRERAVIRAARRFGGRWLGLWSPSDEALNVLAASARHDVEYESLCAPAGHRSSSSWPSLPIPAPTPRLRLPVPVGAARLVPQVLLLAPTRLAKGPMVIANHYLEPLWRRWIGRALSAAVQGSDLPAAVAAYVSPWPLPLTSAREHIGLPSAAVARIDRAVTDHNTALAPVARQLLMQSALEGIPAAGKAVAGSGLSGPDALVHTAYFADRDVRELIVRHITATCTSGGRGDAYDELEVWLKTHRQAVQERFGTFLTSIGL